jgi:hypothetical protein
MTYAQVIDEGNGGPYNNLPITDQNGVQRERLPGEILVRTQNNRTQAASETYVLPLLDYITRVPLHGEIVQLHMLPSGNAESKYNDNRFYYTTTLNLHGSRNINQLPWIMNTVAKGSALDSFISAEGAKVPEQSSFTEKSINALQPYEGDLIINDRFGSSIRFSSGVDTNSRASNGSLLYNTLPPWDGPINEPLMILTAGNSQDSNVENFQTDASSIILSTSQKLELDTSQQNVGRNVSSIRNYSEPQIVLNSDRITINSKADEVIISGKSTVSIATPGWASDMDKFFTMVEDIQNELKSLQSQVNALTTQVNTLSVATTTFGSAQASVAAGLVILAPLAPAPGALAAASGIVTGQTTSILTRLSTIKANLSKIDSTIASLKQ